MRLLLAVSVSALALGLVGIATAGVRVGWLLAIGQGEQVLVPASVVLMAAGLAGILRVRASDRRRRVAAALGLGIAGIVIVAGVRVVTALVFAEPSGIVFVPYRESASSFAWPVAWLLVFGPALSWLGLALVLVALITLVALVVQRFTRRSPSGA